MVERNQQTPIPFQTLSNVAGKASGVRFYQLQCPQRHIAERNNKTWLDNGDGPAQMIGTVADLASCRRRVSAGLVAWVAQQGIRDEDLLAPYACMVEQRLKISSCLIAIQRYSADIGAQTSGRLRNKQRLAVQTAVRVAKHTVSTVHTRTGTACRNIRHEIKKDCLSASSHNTFPFVICMRQRFA
jgi:hypothetical protein